MRKLLLALLTMFFMAGLVVAVEVTVVSYDKDTKELKVKEGDAEKVYMVTDKTKFATLEGKGDTSKESNYAAFEKRVTGKGGKKGIRIDITTDGNKITEAKWRTFTKKKKDKE